MRETCRQFVYELQDTITERLSALDGCPFREDLWTRPGGGGGRTRVIRDGGVFEKGGVNVSEVHGEVDAKLSDQLAGEGSSFYATGISLVLHPRHPRVPTVHANFRYLERGERWWFGGGADLTPYVLFPEDARGFHRVWKDVCDRYDPGYYARFKKWCDEYFYLPHRGEGRGIGGIFFDHLSADDAAGRERLLAWWKDLGGAFLDAYVPIVERRKNEPWNDSEREFQLLRRGRYVEFNLLYDRGTVFGLRSKGRIESILMSLPPAVHWDYDPAFPDEGPEAELLAALRSPRDWLAEEGDEERDA